VSGTRFNLKSATLFFSKKRVETPVKFMTKENLVGNFVSKSRSSIVVGNYWEKSGGKSAKQIESTF
jgi:hypothetical protein